MAIANTQNPNYALNFDTLDVNAYGYTKIGTDPTFIQLSGDAANRTRFDGDGLTYHWLTGAPTGGTLTSFKVVENDALSVNITGFTLDAATVYKNYFTGSEATGFSVDTQGFLTSALSGNDHIVGGSLNDVLRGYAGNDALYGGAGNDVLGGGAGRDVLRGEAGADTFDFNSSADSGTGDAGRDVVYFSQVEGDKVDLSDIDTNINLAGDQGFTHVGSYFKGNPGDFKLSSTGLFQADMNGDKVVDMEIKFSGAIRVSDFIL